jgi:hypothetical protein
LPAAAAPPLVRNPYPIRVDGAPGLVVKGDFGGDSADDLVVVQQRDAIRAFINVVGGPFKPVVTTPITDPVIKTVAPGHFDADGFLDLIVEVMEGFRIYQGNGDGSFRAGPIVDRVGGTGAMTVADFNGDGTADVAVGYSSLGLVAVYLGDGNGSLGTQIHTQLPATATDLLTADFNDDGYPDLVLSHLGSTAVALGLGDGRFRATFTRSGGGGLGAAIGDFDGDTKLDLFAAADAFGAFQVLRGMGDGTFVAAAGTVRLSRNPGAHRLRVVDVDGDGALDVLGAPASGVLGVLRGNGDGTFDAPEYWLTDALDRFHTGDFDRNGTTDVVYLHRLQPPAGGWLYMLPGSGGGTFDGHRAYDAASPSPLTIAMQGLTSADVDGDGDPDLVTVTGQNAYDTKELAVFRNDGQGNFGAPLITPLRTRTSQSPPLIGDVNGDGKLDVVAAAETHLGHGDGTFGSAIPIDGFGSGRGFLVDITGDGRLDLLSTGDFDASSTAVLHGSGTGTFTRAGSLPFRVDVVADLNGDGRPDVAGVVSSYNPARVGINDGHGGFVLSDALPVMVRGVLSAADFNGDGRVDLLIDGHASTLLRVAFGRGDGTFVDAGYMYVNIRVWERLSRTADLDGDGALDLIVEGGVLLGDGAGRFRSHAAVRGAGRLNAIADFDGDGDLDLAVHNGPYVSLVRPNVGPDPPLAPTMTLTATPATAPRYAERITYQGILSMPSIEQNGGALLLSVDGVPEHILVLDFGYSFETSWNFVTGTHSVTMAYSGDTYHAPVSETRVVEVGRGLTEIAGTAVPRTCAAEIQVAMTLKHFNGVQHLSFPTGGLTFRAGNTLLPSRSVPNLTGSLVSGLGVGTHTVVAEYAGDANYEPSSRTFTQVVDPLPYAAGIIAGSAVYRNEAGNVASIADPNAGVLWSITNGTIESGQGTARIVYTAGASGQVTLQATIGQSGTACTAAASATVPIVERLPGASMLYTVAPCRLFDTRGGAPLGVAADAELPAAGRCAIPAGAKSVAANITVIAPATSGWMSFWPADQPWPATSTINYRAGKTRANNSIVPLSPDGRIRVRNSGTDVHYLIDVYGYFR